MKAMRHYCLLALGLSCCAQAPVPPAETLVFRMLEGGPLPQRRSVTPKGGQPWKAVASDPWIVVPAGEGKGPMRVTLQDVATKTPGEYKGTIVITTGGMQEKVAVSLRVVPRLPEAKYTYISPPQGCSNTTGRRFPDAALCEVPDEKPPGKMRAPEVGETYRDPNFGALVKTLIGPDMVHAYSTPSPLSAHNRYVLAADMHGAASLVDVATTKVHSHPTTPADSSVWDATDDNLYYYFDSAFLIRYNVETKKKDKLIDFGGEPWNFESVTNGGSSDTTKDNWLAFYAPKEQSLCAVDLKSLKSYCAKYDVATTGVKIDPDNGTVLISKGFDKVSGKRYAFIVGRPGGAQYSVNLEKGTLDFEHGGPEILDWPGNANGVCDPGEHCFIGDHFDTGEDAQGIQYFFGGLETQTPCEFSLYSFQMNKGKAFTEPVETGGGRRRLMKLFRCGGDRWTDYHVGCAKAAPFCVFSTTYGAFQTLRDPNTVESLPRGPHVSEVIVVRTDGSEIRRLMQNRSVPMLGEPAQAYWSTPRAALSNDGAWVVVDSNFGEPNKHRVLLVETGLK